MRKKILSLMMIITMAVGVTACSGNTGSNDSERIAELESEIEDLEQQIKDAKRKASDNSASVVTNSFDSKTQSLIDSINADTAEYQGVCGADAKWYYKDNVLVIKGTGEITDNPWKSDEYNVDSRDKYSRRIFHINWVIIDEGITAIYDGAETSSAFNNELDITKVVLPSTLQKIGSYAFCDCRSLSSINIPDGVTQIGIGAFSGCNLDKVTIEKIELITDETYSESRHIQETTETYYSSN